MKWTQQLMKGFQYLLPSPFTIGILLTLLTFGLGLILKVPADQSHWQFAGTLMDYWNQGFWELLKFAMQMVIMLLLGHVLAISGPVEKLINRLIGFINTSSAAVYFTCLFTILVSLFNWGLGLIFGAIIARKIGEKFQENKVELNYPMVAAAGYVGLMVWHGGLSGSAPLKVADADHFLVDSIGVISMDQTVFSSMNLVVTLALIVVVPAVFYLLSKRSQNSLVKEDLSRTKIQSVDEEKTGAEKLDGSNLFGLLIGAIITLYAVKLMAVSLWNGNGVNFLNTNYINTILFGLGILFHGNFTNFLKACEEALGGTLGIIIQFPIYAGIMGIIKYSGLTETMAQFFIEIANENTLPLFTMISAGLVNIFVPSGGGQWAVQGGIVIESAKALNVSIPKSIIALAYGDQLTNMLQPFWALPLLGITKLKAKQLFPYTIVLFLIGFILFSTFLVFF